MNLIANMSIKLRLIILVSTSIILMILIGLTGLNGMSQSGDAIEKMYRHSVIKTERLANTMGLLNETRAQMLLSLQHDPSSKFATMHDHITVKHIDQVTRDFDQVGQILAELKAGKMDANERTLVGSFVEVISRYENVGINQFIPQLQAKDFEGANLVLLQKINGLFRELEQISAELMVLQTATAAEHYADAQTRYASGLTLLISLLIFAALFSFAMAYLIVKKLMYAVSELNNSATRISNGDLTARSEYASEDELGKISTAFNTMALRFESVIDDVSKATTQLASAATQTSVLTEQANSAIQHQRLETDQVASAMNEMNATVHEVANNTSLAADAAREADEASRNGKQIVANTIQTIDTLASEVGKAAIVIQTLEKDSESIGRVIDVIRGIAEQTNLLALNAAIEAARAGEQGRGFAVVADEVRTLASRTHASTQEIEEMITGLQSGARSAAAVMGGSQQQAQQGVEQTKEAGVALGTISLSIDNINGMNIQIASAAEEQSAVTEEINKNIFKISQIADDTADSAQQTSEASRELAKLAEHLQAIVSKFTIGK